jgi:hypothetical protein
VPGFPAAIGVLGACLVLVTGAAMATEPPAVAPGPESMAALELPEVRWHTLPADVRRVAIGPDGRAWFTRRGEVTPDRAAFQRRVEAACAEPVPWISGGDLLLLDRRGRVWCRSDAERGTLLGYDPAAGRWQERAIDGRCGSVNAGDRWQPEAHESAAGRLFFVAGQTAHVFDGDTWTAESLVRENDEHRLYNGGHRAFNPFQFGEDARGNVYAWSGWEEFGWSGSVGCLVHDGRGWSHLQLHEWGDDDRALVKRIRGGETLGDELGKRYGIRGVLPLADRVVLLPQAGDAQAFALPGAGAGKPDLPPETLARLAGMSPLVRGRDGAWWVGSWASPQNRMPQMLVVAADGAIKPVPAAALKFGRPETALAAADGRIYFGTCDRGCAAVAGDEPEVITGLGQEDIREILGADRAGRIFLRGRDRLHAWHPRFPETRRSLPSVIFSVPPSSCEVVHDSRGRVWAQTRTPGDGVMRLSFNDGAWQVCEPEGAERKRIVFIQPLRDGGLVVQWHAEREAFLYDGQAWHRYDTLTALVTARHAELVKRIDNRMPVRNAYANLRVDAAGRIWIVEWTTTRVHDGTKVEDIARQINAAAQNRPLRQCWPMPGTTGMLFFGEGVAVKVVEADGRWRCERLSGPARVTPHTAGGIGLDSRGRIWLPNDVASVIEADGEGVREVSDAGQARFEDAAGRIWFATDKDFVVLDRQGRRTRAPLWPNARLTEVGAGSIWSSAPDGLEHWSVTDGSDGPEVKLVVRYTKDTPGGGLLDMFVDERHRLWCFTYGPESYRLWRLELPQPGPASK